MPECRNDTPLLGSAAHARPDRSRPRHGLCARRELRRRPASSGGSRRASRSRPAASRASPSGESEGFGVRVLVDGAWGFAASHVLTAAEADRVAAEAVRIARASATALRDRAGSTIGRRPTARYETPVEEDPFAVPLETQDRRPARRGPGRRAGQGHRLHRVELRRPARVEDLRRDRRQPDRAGHHPRRRRRRGQRDRRRRAPAPELPGLRRRLAGGAATSSSAALDLAERRRAARRRGRRAADARPQCPSGRFTIVLDPRQLYLQVHERCGHPTELDRVFGTEASLRRHELPDDRQARRGLPLRLGPHRHRRRRDRARRHGHVRLGRRGRRGAGRAARPGRDLRRLPDRAARRRRGSAARAAARCGPTAGTGSRSSG